MLSLRRRGGAGNWYIRGTVWLGERCIEVAEFSTGTRDEDAARHLMGERERGILQADGYVGYNASFKPGRKPG